MKLLALRCPHCATPLTPTQDEVVVMGCSHCFSAVFIEEQGLRLAQVKYAQSRQDQVYQWLPFWVFNGRVDLVKRETQGSRSANREAEKFWQAPRWLYVPAWSLPLSESRVLGQQLIHLQPRFQATPRPDEALLQPVTVTEADALKLLEFVVLTIEAQRKDWLKDLRFHIKVSESHLWVLPATEAQKFIAVSS